MRLEIKFMRNFLFMIVKHTALRKFFLCLLCLTFMWSCSKKSSTSPKSKSDFISAVDVSSYPEILKSNPEFKNFNHEASDFLDILKSQGVNTIRLRLWVHPENEHSSFQEVASFSHQLKQMGFKIWLTLHYSDSWAHPGQQVTPIIWQGLDFFALKDSVYQYTKKVVQSIEPDFIQIGNEINTGILHPQGDFIAQPSQCTELLQAGIDAVRTFSAHTKIILHFAGLQDSEWFFDQMNTVDYDIIGLSYYPIWHGKSLALLQEKMLALSQVHQKNIVVAETAYPFTLGWNDFTQNIVGLENQLILPEYTATPDGQRKFVAEIKQIVASVPLGLGFCYWGAELIAWKGPEALDASPWENQALFNFQNQALPALKEFRVE